MARIIRQRKREAGRILFDTAAPPPPPPLPRPPTVSEMALNFAGALARWSQAGFATVSREQYQRRAAACDRCEFWNGTARAGLGKCSAPGCGCTGLKRWLASERCPLRKW